MTLGAWMRNYLYIPLGGNRKSAVKTYINLWTVFLFSGLWHGASWTFIIWGAYHGFWMVVERIGFTRLTDKLPAFIRVLACFFIVTLGWVLFRIEKLADAIQYLRQMFTVNLNGYESPNGLVWFTLFAACLISFSAFFNRLKQLADSLWYNLEHLSNRKTVWLLLPSLVFFVCSLSRIVGTGFNPFIYFRF